MREKGRREPMGLRSAAVWINACVCATDPNAGSDGDLVNELGEVINKFPDVLQQFESYKGSGDLIRNVCALFNPFCVFCMAFVISFLCHFSFLFFVFHFYAFSQAISSPSPETEQKAWSVVHEGVSKLRDFFEISPLLERSLPRVYAALCVGEADAALQAHQALAKVLCQMLDFSARFDDMKMVNPAVQNDLAYYRRVLSRLKREKKVTDGEIRDDTVDRMSLFYAHASPMTRVVIDTTTQFLASDASASAGQVNKVLARLAETCRGMVADGVISNDSTQQMCLRSMTMCLIILDHITEGGIFTKKSPVDITGCIKLLRSETAHNTDSMLNALRFMTAHVRDANVLPFVKKNLW